MAVGAKNSIQFDKVGAINGVPSSGGDGGTCFVQVESGYSGPSRSCILRFTVGTATADVTIVQVGFV